MCVSRRRRRSRGTRRRRSPPRSSRTSRPRPATRASGSTFRTSSTARRASTSASPTSRSTAPIRLPSSWDGDVLAGDDPLVAAVAAAYGYLRQLAEHLEPRVGLADGAGRLTGEAVGLAQERDVAAQAVPDDEAADEHAAGAAEPHHPAPFEGHDGFQR